jgi:hypothetical protein
MCSSVMLRYMTPGAKHVPVFARIGSQCSQLPHLTMRFKMLLRSFFCAAATRPTNHPPGPCPAPPPPIGKRTPWQSPSIDKSSTPLPCLSCPYSGRVPAARCLFNGPQSITGKGRIPSTAGISLERVCGGFRFLARRRWLRLFDVRLDGEHIVETLLICCVRDQNGHGKVFRVARRLYV